MIGSQRSLRAFFVRMIGHMRKNEYLSALMNIIAQRA